MSRVANSGDGAGSVGRAESVLGEAAGGEVEVDAESVPARYTVPADSWVDVLRAARDDLGFRYFDWLSAVDELEAGYTLVTHLARVGTPGMVEHLLIATRLAGEEPRVESAVGVFAGASWHERETHEMFGIDFAGHPDLSPLLLPDEFEGHPLRKDFVLASRVAKPWPGAKEPGESDATSHKAPSRRKVAPPGVPSPQEWGPRPPGDPESGGPESADPESADPESDGRPEPPDGTGA